MSYSSTILADSPQGFWKLYELTGSQAADESGNARHATILTSSAVTSIPVVYGLGGPILTDSPTYGMSGGVARAPVASALNTTGAFSWEVWGYTGNPTANTAVLLTRANSAAGIGGSCIRINGQTITGRVRLDSTGSTNYEVSYGNTLPWNTWFHVVLTRNGNALLLYVNGYLRDQRTDLPGDTITLTEANWGISAIPTGLNNAETWGVSCAAIYNTQLSAARVLAHYEASQLVLPLRATITISLGVELNTDQIVPKDLGFAHNFSDTFGDSQVPIIEELSWKTNVNQSEPDYQQRVNAQPHGALRTLEYHLSPASGAARSRLHGCLYAPAQTYTLPIWSDMGVTTGTASSGTNTIPVDTTKRDYQVGSYVGACTDLQDPSTYQFFKISAVADAQLALESNIGTTIPSGSPVFPARLASISDDTLAVKSFAADHEDSIIRFEILETELSTRRITTYTPSTTYKSIEVFSLESAKVHFLDSRPYDLTRRIEAVGRDYQAGKDTGSPQTFPVRFLLTTRSALSDFYGWLDARQGKSQPLWVSSKERDLTITSIPGASITVSPKTGFSLHHGRRDVEFAKTDGTFLRARVLSIVDNGSTETWTFDQTPPALAQLTRASFLKYCTLAADTVQLRHWKGGANGLIVSESTLSFRELLTSPA